MRIKAKELSRSRTPRLYEVWRSMKRRCEQPTHTFYKYYGARGISVCEEWHDFHTFAQWAVDNGYDINAEHLKCTLDRIDSNGNYEPSNCRWVDMKVQNNNKDCNIYVEFEGKTLTVAEWGDELNLTKDQVWRMYHLKRKGRSIPDYLEAMKYHREEYEEHAKKFKRPGRRKVYASLE